MSGTPPAAAAQADAGLAGAGDARLMRRAALASVSVAVVLVAAKAVAWHATGSVAMLSSLIDSGLDTLSSLVTLFAIREATMPADREHRFGHGKAEGLSSLFQAVVVVGSGLFLLGEGFDRMIEPQPVENGLAGILVMLLSVGLTCGLVLYQQRIVDRTRSLAVAGDRMHYLTDLASNLAVLAALVLYVATAWTTWDALAAFGIALYMIFSAGSIARGALDMLMDRELPNEARTRLREIALAHKDVLDMHDLRTRRSGVETYIQMHLEFEGDLTLSRVHETVLKIEEAVAQAFPGAEVLIHMDPKGVKEPRRVFPARQRARFP